MLPILGLSLPDCFQKQHQGAAEPFLSAVPTPKFQAGVLKYQQALESPEGLLEWMAGHPPSKEFAYLTGSQALLLVQDHILGPAVLEHP